MLQQYGEKKQRSITNWNSLHWSCCNKEYDDFNTLQCHQQSFHQTNSKADVYYQCCDCKEQILGYASFLNHVRGVHYEALKLCCDVCNNMLPDFMQLALHRDMHISTRNSIYPTVHHCTLCEEVHSTEKELKNHIQQSHSLIASEKSSPISFLDIQKDKDKRITIKKKYPYSAKNSILECRPVVTKNEMLQQCDEKKEHSIANWKSLHWSCCNKEFGDFYTLQCHQQSFHQINSKADVYYQCYDCKEQILGYSSFLNHIRGVHYQILKLCCDVCNEMLPDFIQLALHRDMHISTCNNIHPNIYHCTLCEKVYSTEKELKKHIQQSHSLIASDETNPVTFLSRRKNKDKCKTITDKKSSSAKNFLLENRTVVPKNEMLLQCDEKKEPSITNWNSVHWSCCNTEWYDFYTLQFHQKSIHQIKSPAHFYYQCYDCKDQILGYASFLNHIRGVHYETLKLCCDVCSEILPNFAQLASHRNTHIDSRNNIHPTIYHCTLCEEVHSTEKELKNHIQHSHDLISSKECNKQINEDKRLETPINLRDDSFLDEKIECKEEYVDTQMIFPCGKCVQNFTTAIDLQHHMTTHFNDNSYECETCSLNFKTNDEKKKHMSTHTNASEYAFICEVCKKVFNRSYALTVHMRTHNNDFSYNCHVCEKVFNDKTDLANHILLHTEERPFKCEKCPKKFKHKIYLQKHTCSQTNKAIFKCEICKKVFAKNSALQTHMHLHSDDRPYKCEVCDKGFAHRTSFRDHVFTHTKEYAYKCHICEKIFSTKSNLKVHTLIHNERIHKCEICDKEFVNKISLNNHMLVHSGENVFICEICEKVFCSQITLKIHMRSHTGDNYFKCNICGKKFFTNSKLRYHMNVHTDKRPIKCKVCSKRFKDERYLQRHRKICPKPEL